MDPVSISSIILSGIGSNMLASLLERVAKGEDNASERLEQAKKEYQEATIDFSTPLERKRQQLLIELTNLQADLMLTIANNGLLLRMLILHTELMTEAYQARTERELKFVELGSGRIEGTIEQYKKVVNRRTFARTLAVAVSFIALVGLGVLIYWGTLPNGPSVNDVFPVIQVPLPVLIWSAVGSFTAILYRFNKSGDVELQDSLRWLFTRPLTGIMMGTISYFILKVGFLSIEAGENVNLGSLELMWLMAFITGFSDRFADNILKLLAGRFGYENESGLVTLEQSGTALPNLSVEGIQSLLEEI